MAKVYIAGKITGDPKYKEKFEKAEEELKAQGHLVMNPAVLSEGFTWMDYMKITARMLSVCDTIYLLSDWEESKGANLEKLIAESSNYTILYENHVTTPK